MVNIETVVEPDMASSTIYDDIYGRFLEECRSRNLFT